MDFVIFYVQTMKKEKNTGWGFERFEKNTAMAQPIPNTAHTAGEDGRKIWSPNHKD